MTDAATDRLARLEGYLAQDPGNALLLADACDTALACGDRERALRWIEQAERLALPPAAWLLRRARLCIAQRELARAAALLQEVGALQPGDPLPVHDLAHVRLLQGDAEAARALVQPWIAPPPATLAPDTLDAMQVLWLRAMHHQQLLQQAWDWILAARHDDSLQPAAHGVASLIALDRGAFDAALEFAEAALRAHPRQPEALVARGCVALAVGETQHARKLLEQALQCNPQEGRAWSALGLVALREGQLALAQAQLERAVAGMPAHVGTWHALGWSQLLQGRQDAALAAFRRALDLDGNFAESHGALGLVLSLRGEREAGQRHLDIAQRLDRDNVTGRYARALLAGEAADPQRLRALAARLLDRPGFFGGRLSDALPAARH